jgi:MSHA pilin protein MshC
MRNDKGFTLVELVVLLLLIGIIAIFVAPRMLGVSGTKAAAFVDKLRADVRFAQNMAMTQSRRARMYFNGVGTAPASGYAVVIDTSATGNCSGFVPVADPAIGGNLTITLNAGDYAGITVTPSTTCLEFDSFGRPYDCSASLAVCSPTAGGMNADVNANPLYRVTVTPQTGAVN